MNNMGKTATLLLACFLVMGLAGLTSCKNKKKADSIFCDPNDASDCADDEACVYNVDEDDYVCTAVCDPLEVEPCGPGLVCEQLVNGRTACFKPVRLAGQVFDIETDPHEGIEGAHVAGANEAGLVVTDVVITDAGGMYELDVPVTRDASGVPQGAIFTLRVSAQDYQPYPYGIRPAIPVDTALAAESDEAYVVQNLTTDVGMIPLDATGPATEYIEGSVDATNPGGTLIVAEEGPPAGLIAPYTFADREGYFTIFNVPVGSYVLRGYKQHQQLNPENVDVADGQPVENVVLTTSSAPLGSITGQVNIVNAPGDSATSVVLVPEATFSDTFVRGVVPPGLRDPAPGLPYDVTGAFEIRGVPEGTYVVLAAFENDFLVRDPDPSIAGTQIVHQEMPDPVDGVDVALETSFKITEALEMFGPGANEPEPVDPLGTIEFMWADDSSEDFYSIVVYNAFGELVWEDPNVPRVTGDATVVVTYGGPTLDQGMYYQWRATSHRNTGPISMTEDLRGVFFTPAGVR
jgi:hypothetical protein